MFDLVGFFSLKSEIFCFTFSLKITNIRSMLRPYVIKTQEIYMHMKCWLHRILESFTMHITMLIIRCLYIEKYLHV